MNALHPGQALAGRPAPASRSAAKSNAAQLPAAAPLRTGAASGPPGSFRRWLPRVLVIGALAATAHVACAADDTTRARIPSLAPAVAAAAAATNELATAATTTHEPATPPLQRTLGERTPRRLGMYLGGAGRLRRLRVARAPAARTCGCVRACSAARSPARRWRSGWPGGSEHSCGCGKSITRIAAPGGSRQVKAPKVYVADSGVLRALPDIGSGAEALASHPRVGASWEGFALQQIVRALVADWRDCHHWRAHTGADLDLLVVHNGRRLGFEINRSDAPRMTPSMYSALEVLRLERPVVVHAGDKAWPMHERVLALSMADLFEGLRVERSDA